MQQPTAKATSLVLNLHVKLISWLSELNSLKQQGWHQKPLVKTLRHFSGLYQICKIIFRPVFQPSDYMSERSQSYSVLPSFPWSFGPLSHVVFNPCYTKLPSFKLAQSRIVRQRRETTTLLLCYY